MKSTVASTVALNTHNLSIGYEHGKNILLNNLNLTLSRGHMICFMGPNGIGKSTLIRTLAGLQKPLNGTVTYASNKDLPQQLAVVLTDRISSTELVVYDLIVFGRYPYLDWTIKLSDADKLKINEVINLIGIQSLVNKKIDELSDGQLQLVMIARALAQDCDIILLDEPTAHLDLNNRVEIMNLLRNIAHQQNKAILVATHELDLALQTADKIWLAGLNQNVVTGMPEDLVLNGSFDEIFRFKGFDLKTGKIQHTAYRETAIALHGDGPELLWTRNALERNGFIININAETTITLIKEAKTLTWKIKVNNSETVCDSLESMINILCTN